MFVACTGQCAQSCQWHQPAACRRLCIGTASISTSSGATNHWHVVLDHCTIGCMRMASASQTTAWLLRNLAVAPGFGLCFAEGPGRTPRLRYMVALHAMIRTSDEAHHRDEVQRLCRSQERAASFTCYIVLCFFNCTHCMHGACSTCLASPNRRHHYCACRHC